jgi:hypothetical protein
MEWKFESGIVGVRTNVYGSLAQRVYHVRYSSNTHLRRLITASFTYTKMSAENREKFIETLLASDSEEFKRVTETTGTLIPSMSNVIAIMDFDITEKDQQPPQPNGFEGSFHTMVNDSQDENDFLTLRHFELNLVKCKYDKCVCTLTNDEEASKRIEEVTTAPVKSSVTVSQAAQPFCPETCENPELAKALKRIFELEAIVIQQRHTIEDLKSKVN